MHFNLYDSDAKNAEYEERQRLTGLTTFQDRKMSRFESGGTMSTKETLRDALEELRGSLSMTDEARAP